MKAVYYNKVRQEKDKVCKTAFWKEFLAAVLKIRKTAVDHCVQDKGDTSYYQGKARAFRDVLVLPDKIMEELKTEAQKGNISPYGETPEREKEV